MAKHSKPWSQQTQKEKVESLRIRQQRIVKSLNLLARRIEPGIDKPLAGRAGERRKPNAENNQNPNVSGN